MPDKEVKTIRDLIFYQYAKIIARSAFNCSNGIEAKRANYGFIKKTFRDLRDGRKDWSGILREDLQFIESDKRCVFCGSDAHLTKEHIVPKTLKINEHCTACDHIHGIHNIIWSCQSCNSKKGRKGLYTFFAEICPENSFLDFIPPLLEKKYLKTIYLCHQCAGTLDDCPEKPRVFDLDRIIETYTRKQGESV